MHTHGNHSVSQVDEVTNITVQYFGHLQTSHSVHQIGAWGEHEVVCIGENDLGIFFSHHLRGDALDTRFGGTKYKRGSLDFSMGSNQKS